MFRGISFSDFVLYVEEHLLQGWRETLTIRIESICKNNGRTYTALLLQREDVLATPTIYLEDAYEVYQKTEDLEDAIVWIRTYYELSLLQMDEFTDFNLFDFEKVQDHIVYRLVNFEKNKEMLKDCPYIRLYDLAVTFRCVISTTHGAISSTLIHNDLMDQWKIGVEELTYLAQENTERLFPSMIRGISDVLSSSDHDSFVENEMMYIATNEHSINGAGVILYDGFLEEFARNTKGDFYILPSSIHEVILVPCQPGIFEEDLKEMVCQANLEVVDEEEILSDSVYCYRKDQGKIVCCAS
ncbi:MAG: DUF5688 family protein [Eubacteriales bacterium]|nr:DUF5688 family protein [Eubacteriales bacterium]